MNVLSGGRSAGADRGLARVGIRRRYDDLLFNLTPGKLPAMVPQRPIHRSSAKTPGRAREFDIALTMRKVRRDVLKATGNKQLPWEVASLTGDLVLGSNDGSVVPSDNAPSSEDSSRKDIHHTSTMNPSSAPGETPSVFLYEENYGGSAPTAVRGNIVVWSVQEQSRKVIIRAHYPAQIEVSKSAV